MSRLGSPALLRPDLIDVAPAVATHHVAGCARERASERSVTIGETPERETERQASVRKQTHSQHLFLETNHVTPPFDLRDFHAEIQRKACLTTAIWLLHAH